MKSILIKSTAIAAAALGAYYFLPAPVERVPLPAEAVATPELQFQQLISRAPVLAEQLKALCDKYPQLADKMLRGRPIRVTGTVQGLFVTGLAGRRALVTLERGTGRSLVAVYDLDHYTVSGLDQGDHQSHYLVVANELFKVKPRGTYYEGTSRTETKAEVRTLLFTLTLPYTDMLTLRHISAGEIVFEAQAK